MTSQLDGLKRHSVIVADTGDIESIARFGPQDATTNPSLIFKAAQDLRYRPIIDEAIESAPAGTDADARLGAVIDHLFVGFGRRILGLIPGRVSTEVDARLSFDTEATEAKARRLIDLYEAAGVPRPRWTRAPAPARGCAGRSPRTGGRSCRRPGRPRASWRPRRPPRR